MSEKRFKRVEWNCTSGEVRRGAIKYVESITSILKKSECGSLMTVAKEMVAMGYALGVIAGKLSDSGVEGFTLLLNGVKISLGAEDRKEKMQFAIWDKEGELHTSEESYRIEEGGKA